MSRAFVLSQSRSQRLVSVSEKRRPTLSHHQSYYYFDFFDAIFALFSASALSCAATSSVYHTLHRP